MKSLIITLTAIILTTIFLFIACKKEESTCHNCNDSSKRPSAHAGADQVTGLPKDSILLDGSASIASFGVMSEWLWTKVSGPFSYEVVTPTAVTTIVKKLVPGTYKFTLKTTNSYGLWDRDTVQVIVYGSAMNQPPLANAGEDQTIILPRTNTRLDGSKSVDPDNNIISYTWTKIAGPSAGTIFNSNSVQTDISRLVQGTYQFELSVKDNEGLSAKDTVQINVGDLFCGTNNRPQISLQSFPIGNLSKARTDMAIASAGNKILFAGGMTVGTEYGKGESRVDIYDISTNTWSTAELSAPRFYITAIAAGNKVFFAGGTTGHPDDFNQVDYAVIDVYDVSTNTWSVINLMEPKFSITAASVGNKVFFAGGMGMKRIGNTTYFGQLNSTVEIYDLLTNTWSYSNLSEEKTGMSAVTLNNKIYFAGGYSRAANYASIYSNKIEIYDAATASWSITTLNEGRSEMQGTVIGNKLYWAGGATYQGSSCKVEIKDETNQSTTIDYLSGPNVSTAVLKDNKIVYFRANNKIDVYETNTQTWFSGTLPASAPTGLTVISVNNIIYAAGGGMTVNNFFIPSTQVYKIEL